MTNDIRDSDLLTKALDFAGRDARWLMADAVYCALFNAAGAMEGNTAETDVQWFAYLIYQDVNPHTSRQHWEQMTPELKEHWLSIGRACLNNLPALMSRMANRCRQTAEAVKTLMRAEKAERDNIMAAWRE